MRKNRDPRRKNVCSPGTIRDQVTVFQCIESRNGERVVRSANKKTRSIEGVRQRIHTKRRREEEEENLTGREGDKEQ
jgi:hypothetical protein